MRSRKTDAFRLCRIALPLAALLAGSAFAAPSLQSDAMQPAGMQADDPRNGAFDDGADRVNAAPLPWSQLNPNQREMLAPLQSQWDRLPPRRQQRMAAHAEHWMQLPPERRAQIQQRMVHWAQMTPEQRRDVARNEHAFQSMAPADRQRVQEAFQRFQSLSPEQRRMLMQRFRAERRARQGMGEQGQPPPRH